jgi:hypothetical protein
MTDEAHKSQFRTHLREIGRALEGLGKDVEIDVADAPHTVRVGTQNTLAKAAGVRRTPLEAWSEPVEAAPHEK